MKATLHGQEPAINKAMSESAVAVNAQQLLSPLLLITSSLIPDLLQNALYTAEVIHTQDKMIVRQQYRQT